MRTLYLHIGTHRTATSSTQKFLYMNQKALLARGFLYPFNTARHLPQFNQLFGDKIEVGAFAEDLDARAARRGREAQAVGGIHSVVLSDEDVCMRRDLSRLAGLRQNFDVKVVFALRRQDLWLESWYLQNIKWQWNRSLSHCTLDEFLARRAEFFWADYDRYVRHLEEVFGRENVLLYVFEKEQMPDGPVAAFCRMIGLDDLSGLEPAPHANSSYSTWVSEFMRLLPLDEAPAHYRSQLERACGALEATLTAGGRQSSTLLIDHARRQEILAEHAAGNAALAQRYFDREALFLAPVPGPEAPLARMELPADTTVLMRDYVAPFVRGLIAQNRERPAQAAQAPTQTPAQGAAAAAAGGKKGTAAGGAKGAATGGAKGGTTGGPGEKDRRGGKGAGKRRRGADGKVSA